MKDIEPHFAVLFSSTLYEVVFTFEHVNEVLKYYHSMKAIEQYFPALLFNIPLEYGLSFYVSG